MITFDGEKPWKRITRLASGKKRNWVAVPFMHGDASRLLPLKQGDVLKVNIMSGQVSPDALRHYLAKQVEVFTVPDLHAKVFVLGNSVIVGSTNVSFSSESKLVEAVVETQHPPVRAAAKRFIEALESYPVNDTWLRTCERVYQKPRFGADRSSTDVDVWCLDVLRQIAPRHVTHDGRSRYYLSVNANSVKRVYLRLDQNAYGQAVILLLVYPADTGTQAKAFYSAVDEKKLTALTRRDWVISPNLHFGFAISGLCWTKTAFRYPTMFASGSKGEYQSGQCEDQASNNYFS